MKTIGLLFFFGMQAALLKAQDHSVTLKVSDEKSGSLIAPSSAYLSPETSADRPAVDSREFKSDHKGTIAISIPDTFKKWHIIVKSPGFTDADIKLQTSSKPGSRLFYTVKLKPVK